MPQSCKCTLWDVIEEKKLSCFLYFNRYIGDECGKRSPYVYNRRVADPNNLIKLKAFYQALFCMTGTIPYKQWGLDGYKPPATARGANGLKP